MYIVAFIKKKPKLTLYFDPDTPNIDQSCFTGDEPEVFKDHYRDAKEELPERMPQPRGRSVKINAFVDASHASDKVTRRSKKQNTVESSAFSSEFIVMKTCIQQMVSLRFKLRMFGIPIDGFTAVLTDNESVMKNTSKIDSSLNKKHSSIPYHAVRWSVAAGVLRVGWVITHENIADAFTKRLRAQKRDYLFGNWTY